MKAIRIHEFGGPEVLELEDIEVPKPAEDEVLIKVYASSVNPVDQKIFAGEAEEKFPTKFPLTIGWDVSGVSLRPPFPNNQRRFRRIPGDQSQPNRA
jgi:NADPH:quinone reductase-like Zn-dependent oxidoreductase